jgi:hypothetical protein
MAAVTDFGVTFLICETVLKQPCLLAGNDGVVFDCAVQCGSFGGNGEKILCSLLVHGSYGFHVERGQIYKICARVGYVRHLVFVLMH